MPLAAANIVRSCPDDWKQGINWANLLLASPDQSVLAVAFGNDLPVILYSTRDWNKLAELSGVLQVSGLSPAYPEPGGHVVIGAAFSPDGTKLAVAGHASREPVRIFNVSDALLVAAHSEPVYETGDGLTWSRDGRFIAFMTGGRTRILHLWDPFRPEPSERTIELVSGPHSHAIALSAQAGKLAVDIEQNIRVFNLIR
jgi:WD40 repeat protein